MAGTAPLELTRHPAPVSGPFQEKCMWYGCVIATERSFAEARSAEIEELVLQFGGSERHQ